MTIYRVDIGASLLQGLSLGERFSCGSFSEQHGHEAPKWWSAMDPHHGVAHHGAAQLGSGNGWVAGGCWDDYETSDEMDHSRKFPVFSTSK